LGRAARLISLAGVAASETKAREGLNGKDVQADIADGEHCLSGLDAQVFFQTCIHLTIFIESAVSKQNLFLFFEFLPPAIYSPERRSAGAWGR
jgi:hypothetical protein